MMDDGFRGMHDEVSELRRRLDRMGVEHEDSNEITYFENRDGGCTVFPSVQHEGHLFVTFTASEYCDTADEALGLCGLGGRLTMIRLEGGRHGTLLPCPFCGSKAELVQNGSGDIFARCSDRNCAARSRLFHENENGAVIAWNRRSSWGGAE